MFTAENTNGFSGDELEEMNYELTRRIDSDELDWVPDAEEREKLISERIFEER